MIRVGAGQARVATRLRLVGAAVGPGPSPTVELLHPGPGLGWLEGHRWIDGGVLTDDGALLVLPGLRQVALAGRARAGRALFLAQRVAGGVALWRWHGDALHPLRTLDCSDLHMGGEWLLAWRGARAWAERLEDGAPVALPLGAQQARAHPWPLGPGASWVDGAALLQQVDATAPPMVVGVATERLRRLRVGPAGACVVEGRGQAWLHAPGKGLVPCELEGPLSEVAFAPDGGQALIAVAEGVLRVDLSTGEVFEARGGGRPAGWGGWLDAGGDRHRWRQADGFIELPGPGLRLGTSLHGPAGREWDLRTGAALGPARTAGATLACALPPAWPGDLLLVVDGEVLLDDGRRRRRLHSLPLGEEPVTLAVEGPLARVSTRGGSATGGPSPASWSWSAGPNASLPSPALSSPALLAVTLTDRLGLPLHGALSAPDGSTWAWQDGGPLLRLRG